MNTGLKIGGFAAALAVTFGAAYGVGSGVGPLSTEPESGTHEANHGEAGTGGTGDGHGGHGEDAPAGGLQISDQGYTLDLRTPTVDAGESGELRFRILDEDGEPVTAYEEKHDKELHLILASRDLATYRHVHPTRADDGTWSSEVKLPRAGDYRMFADFSPAGEDAPNLTLGADVAAAGDYDPVELPKETRTADAGDGYAVTLQGDLKPGKSGPLSLEVTREGEEVTNLSPYLGAYGHLVALRAGDLAYLHVHPDGEPGDGKTEPGPEISFNATAPSAGSYRIFLDFKHEGTVRTAEFTVHVGTASGAAPESGPGEDQQDGTDPSEGGHGGHGGHGH